MSAICIFDFTENNLTYSSMDSLSKEIVRFVLDIDKGVFFYVPIFLDGKKQEKIKGSNMRNAFEITEKFFNSNCEFIENFNEKILKQNGASGRELKSFFTETFGFLEKLLDIIFKYDVSAVKIYLADDNVDKESDFEIVETTKQEFLNCLYDKSLESSDFFNDMPSIKFIIKKA
ncbi:MAG: hypothetical protein IJC07_03690 [Clostridia bacterium]|nr:hypothetical protein [Clostridia bacterium]